MAYVQEAARYTQSTPQRSSVTVTLAHNVAVGHTLMLAVNATNPNAATDWSAIDSQGNTWTKIAQQNSASSNYQVAVLTTQVNFALTTTDTITVTIAGTAKPAGWSVIVDEFDDLAGLDQSNTAFATTNSPTITSTAVGSQNTELVYAAVAWTDSGSVTLTDGAGFTSNAEATAATTPARTMQTMWDYVNSSGTRTASGTLTSSQAWGTVLAVMKQTATLTVDAGSDQTVAAFSTVTLTATAPAGVTVTWTQIGGTPTVTLT